MHTIGSWLRPPYQSRIIAIALLGISCSDSTTAVDIRETGAVHHMPVYSSSQATMEPEALRQRLGRTTRAVALALGNNDRLRNEIHAALSNSPFREGKLEFAALLADEQVGLLTAMAAATGEPPAQLRSAVLDSMVPLEMYLPMPQHRTTWTGSDDLVVASLLSEALPPVDFDLAGSPVDLKYDREAPPSRPVLAIVPAETDFTQPSALDDPSLAVASGSISLNGGSLSSQTASSSSNAIYMVESRHADLGEHPLKGNPEIVLHVYSIDHEDFVSCSGELAALPFRFDQNNTTWVGSVQAITQTQLESFGKLQIQIWEDDVKECNGLVNLTPAPDNTTKTLLQAAGGRVNRCVNVSGGGLPLLW